MRNEVKTFDETEKLAACSQAYVQVFAAIRQTTLGRHLGISDHATRSRLFASSDYITTVVIQLVRSLDPILKACTLDSVKGGYTCSSDLHGI